MQTETSKPIQQEILDLKKKAPKGIYTLVARNLGVDRIKVKNELDTLKDEGKYDQAIIAEFRRLVNVIGTK